MAEIGRRLKYANVSLTSTICYRRGKDMMNRRIMISGRWLFWGIHALFFARRRVDQPMEKIRLVVIDYVEPLRKRTLA